MFSAEKRTFGAESTLCTEGQKEEEVRYGCIYSERGRARRRVEGLRTRRSRNDK